MKDVKSAACSIGHLKSEMMVLCKIHLDEIPLYSLALDIPMPTCCACGK
jgi:hypothetical protein